jgi:hypothetical protein
MADPNQNEDKSLVKILIDVSSEPGYQHNVHVEGNQGVIIDIIHQIFENPETECLVEIFDNALEEYYQKHPDKRIIY